MAKRLFIKYGSLRQGDHDLPTFVYDPATFNLGYELQIHDRDYTGTPDEISEITSDGVVLSMKGGRSNMNKPIVPTLASFTMLINSTAEVSFVSDLTAGDEERFHVELYRWESLIFKGYIIIEQVSQDITKDYRALNITAADGLSRMKEVNFPIDAPGNIAGYMVQGYPTFLELIVRCFKEANITDLYTEVNHKLFNVYINWTESGMDITNVNRRGVLNQIICQDKLFYNLESDSDGFYDDVDKSRTLSCHKVLEKILTLLHAKIFYQDGKYFIRHAWGSEATSKELEYYSYDKNGDFISIYTQDITEAVGYQGSDATRLLAPSATEYIAPHKYIEVELVGEREQAINSAIWLDTDLTWKSQNFFLEGQIINLSLDFTHVITKEDAPITEQTGYWTFEIQVRVGNKYLERNEILTFWQGSWSTDSTKSIIYEPKAVYTSLLSVEFESNLTIICDALLDEGDLEIKLVSVKYYNGTQIVYERSSANTIGPLTGYEGSYHAMQSGLVTQNEDNNTINVYRSGQISGNTRTKKVNLKLGEFLNTKENISQIYTWDNTLGDITPNQDNSPQPDWGGGKLIQQKLLESYTRTHTTTKEILSGTLDSTERIIGYDTVLTWMGNDYMAVDLERITALDRYKGQWIEVGKTAATTTGDTIDIFYIPTRKGFLSPGVNGPLNEDQFASFLGEDGASGVGNLLKSRSYNIDNLNYLQILTHTIPSDIKTEYTRPSIDDSYILYVNGVRWRYVPTLLEVNKAGVFTLEPGTLNWNIFRQLDAEIRLEIWDRLVVEIDTE